MKMTNEQIKEVLDAFDEGKELQIRTPHGEWRDSAIKTKIRLLESISCRWEYRIKPEPKKIDLYGIFTDHCTLDFTEDIWINSDTHKITYLLDENGEPICESIKLEKL